MAGKKEYLKTKDGKETRCTWEMINTVRKILSNGLSNNVAMASINVSKDTFYRWKREIPAFREALEDAQPKQMAVNELEIRKIATGEKKGNVAAWQMYMRNIHGWDKPAGENNTYNQSININNMNVLEDKSIEDLVAYIEDLSDEVKPILPSDDIIEAEISES